MTKTKKEYFDELDQDGLSDEVCDCCKKYITDEFSGGNGWLCEGSFCDQAEEYYLTSIKNGIKFYRKKKIENLNERL